MRSRCPRPATKHLICRRLREPDNGRPLSRGTEPMKSLLSLSALVALTLAIAPHVHAAQPLPRSTPEAQGISSNAVADFIETIDKQINTLHSVVIVRHGYVISEAYWKP